MDDDWSATGFFNVLNDDYNREILAATSIQPLSAHELKEKYDISKTTLYRRINELQELNLLKEQMVVDKNGNHYREFKANLDGAEIKLDEGYFNIKVHFKEDVADKFTKLWRGIGIG